MLFNRCCSKCVAPRKFGCLALSFFSRDSRIFLSRKFYNARLRAGARRRAQTCSHAAHKKATFSEKRRLRAVARRRQRQGRTTIASQMFVWRAFEGARASAQQLPVFTCKRRARATRLAPFAAFDAALRFVQNVFFLASLYRMLKTFAF